VHLRKKEATMKFHSSVIFVNDIEKSKDFYIQLLNQKIEHDFGKNVILQGGLAIWEIQPEHIINERLETMNKSNRFELYFETELIDETYERLNNERIEFLHGIHEEPWGQRTIRFFDHDKHLVEIGEPLETFVNNMNKNGLSSKQIAEKSGIPIKTIISLIKEKDSKIG
jgi:catechol 2,3-dioxygenase-like lactoylglutathione lyase family enzyme